MLHVTYIYISTHCLMLTYNVKRVANVIGVEFTLTLRTGKGRLRLLGSGRASCVLRRKRSKVKSRIKRFSPIAIQIQLKRDRW